MFRKLVSNLPYSPALVGQLGFYAKRLKREEATRRLGLVFTALALVVQSFAVISPPQSANAANPSDLIYGGVTSQSQLLSVYDNSARGNGDFKQIMDYAGITRAEIAATYEGRLNSRERGTGNGQWLSWGRSARMSAADGEVQHNANGSIVYTHPLWKLDGTEYTKQYGSTYDVFIGNSAKMGAFAIMKACGNLNTIKLPQPPPPLPPPPPPQPPQPPTPPQPPSRPPPEASCTALVLKRITRTTYSFTASANTSNSATISKYDFKVKNSGGAVVASSSVSTTAKTANSGVLDLKKEGRYVATVVVTTSVGPKTGQQCTVSVPVSPPDKCVYNPDLTNEDKACQPCPDNPDVWYKSEDCKPKVASDKKATNLTQGNKLATTVTANASDRIEYTVSLYNVGKVPATVDFTEQLGDVLEYSTLQQNGNGTYDDAKQTLKWGSVTIQPGKKETRTFVVAIMSVVPSTPQGASNPMSYDCIMTNAFGNTVNIPVNCELPKSIEEVIEQLPSTGPTENLVFAGGVGSLATYFWARSRQMKKEVRLIRKDFNTGTL